MAPERGIESVIDKLREVEKLVLSMANNPANRRGWDALERCKVHIWKAMDEAISVGQDEGTA
jgi:hypothetical protein